MLIDRAQVAAILRTRGLTDRADWVERALPAHIDTQTNASLLQTLAIDLADLAEVDPAKQPG